MRQNSQNKTRSRLEQTHPRKHIKLSHQTEPQSCMEMGRDESFFPLLFLIILSCSNPQSSSTSLTSRSMSSGGTIIIFDVDDPNVVSWLLSAFPSAIFQPSCNLTTNLHIKCCLSGPAYGCLNETIPLLLLQRLKP